MSPHRRAQGLRRRRVQPAARVVRRAGPGRLGRGEISELRRNPAWANVFLTLKDAGDGRLPPRDDGAAPVRPARAAARGGRARAGARQAPALRGARGAELPARTVERVGAGDHAAALERLRVDSPPKGSSRPSASGRCRASRAAVGLVTGVDAAARGDVVAAITTRFPAVRLVVAETRVQGRARRRRSSAALDRLAARDGVDVVILARGGGSFEDLLPVQRRARRPRRRRPARCRSSPRSATSRTSRSATSPPTSGRRPRRRRRGSSCPISTSSGPRSRAPGGDSTAASRVCSSATAGGLDARRRATAAAPRLLLERRRVALDRAAARLQALSPRATLARGYAIVRAGGAVLREAAPSTPGERVEIELARGGLGARVEEVRAVTRRAVVRGAPARARRDRRAARAGRRRARRGARALGARRGAAARCVERSTAPSFASRSCAVGGRRCRVTRRRRSGKVAPWPSPPPS